MRELIFHAEQCGRLPLPERCSVDVSCLNEPEVQQAVTIALEDSLCMAAHAGIDLQALDGITVATDCRAAACALQNLPSGEVLEVRPQPNSMELARTAAVWRDGRLRFHIVIRSGLGLMTLSPDPEMQRLAKACISHEAAHVEHESHLHRTFPGSYGMPLACGERSRQTFMKAMDVWSEYAACRSSASFRPEAMGEYADIFCAALEASDSRGAEQMQAYQNGGDVSSVSRELQQIFGDTVVCAGYWLGHVHGLQGRLGREASNFQIRLVQQPKVVSLVKHLEVILDELWLTAYNWKSIEVFAPIYDLICEFMALNGMAFVLQNDQWRIVFSEM